jgi:segregation and condensation protein B
MEELETLGPGQPQEPEPATEKSVGVSAGTADGAAAGETGTEDAERPAESAPSAEDPEPAVDAEAEVRGPSESHDDGPEPEQPVEAAPLDDGSRPAVNAEIPRSEAELAAAPSGAEGEEGGSAAPESPQAEAILDEFLPAPEIALPAIATEDLQLRAVLEAIVYVAEEPLTLVQLAAALQQAPDRVRSLLNQLMTEFERPEHGVTIREVAGGYKMATKPEHHEAVRAFVKSLKPPLKLSLPALETLAVIAYKQPCTGPEIMEIRGVQGAGVLKTLIDRKLIAVAGRKNVIGKPILYKTTKEFLIQFGLKDLSELPSLKEFEDIRRMAFADSEMQPAAAPDEPAGSAALSPASVEPPNVAVPPEAEPESLPKSGQAASGETPAAPDAASSEPESPTAASEN